MVKAAAGNKKSGEDVMRLLLDRRGDDVTITDDVVTGYRTGCLHNDRSGRIGPTNKTAKNEAEAVKEERKYIKYYLGLVL